MKKSFFASLLLFVSFQITLAQSQKSLQYVDFIDSTTIRTTLGTLASDEFEGRKTGEKGNEIAANYIADYLKDTGIKAGNNASYFQNIETNIRLRGKKGSFLWDGFNYSMDYSYPNSSQHDSLLTANEIIFVGYGIHSKEYNDFEGLDIKGKTLMKIDDTPYNKVGIKLNSTDKSDVLFAANPPKAILKIRRGFGEFYQSTYSDLVFHENDGKVPEITINEALANRILQSSEKTVKQLIFEMERQGKLKEPIIIEKEVSISGDFSYKNANANNVIGIIEGADLKDEYIVLSAHYDHEGVAYNKSIYYGADDNASGVTALLETGRIMAKAKKEGNGPRRSIILLFPTAEENGLYGSKYYTDNPVYPLEKTIACLNADMVGRISPEYESKGNNYIYIYSNDLSKDLSEKITEINDNSTKLTIDHKRNSYTFNRSDQYNFSVKNVPSVMFHSGEHKDYHKTTDSADAIDYNALWKRTRLIFLTAWELANPPQN